MFQAVGFGEVCQANSAEYPKLEEIVLGMGAVPLAGMLPALCRLDWIFIRGL